MLSPKEIKEISFKTGRGYKKEDVDSFMKALYHDYEIIYHEKTELKDKVNTLSDGIQYYKNLEKTLQKSLVLAEKTAEETKEAARKQADLIEKQAKFNADMIVTDAKDDLVEIERKIEELKQRFELYKNKCKQIARTQIELLEGAAFTLQETERDIELYSDKKQKKKSVSYEEPDLTQVLNSQSYSAPSLEEKLEQNELAKEVSECDKEIKETVVKKDIDFTVREEQNIKSVKEEIAVEKKLAEPEEESEEEIELKMLQKLLNDIRSRTELETIEEGFEFVGTDTKEE